MPVSKHMRKGVNRHSTAMKKARRLAAESRYRNDTREKATPLLNDTPMPLVGLLGATRRMPSQVVAQEESTLEPERIEFA